MRLRYILSWVLCICAAAFCFAGTDDTHRQVLIFRNTGEVNLLYADNLDSITTTHEVQRFFLKDSVIAVPVSEIDSVAFGERNVIEIAENVRELTDADSGYIIKYENNVIYYKLHTPQDFVPCKGEKLYYPARTEIFPYGLSAVVRTVRKSAEAIEVDVEEVELHEIYRRLFYAGPIRLQTGSQAVPMKEIGLDGKIPLSFEMELGKTGKLELGGNVDITGTLVVNIFGHSYFHADIDVEPSIGFGFQLKSDDSDLLEWESKDKIRIPLVTLAKIINIEAAVRAFAELEAELKFHYTTELKAKYRTSWTRRDGVNEFSMSRVLLQEAKEQAQIDVTLNGSLFSGFVLLLDFNIIGVAGVREKLKLGSDFSGEVGINVLRSLGKYDPETYAKGELSYGLRTKMENGVFIKNYFSGEEEYKKLFDHPDFSFGKKVLSLFPDCSGTKAVCSLPGDREVSASTKITVPLERPLEMGFALVDGSGKTVDSTFVTTVDAGIENILGVCGAMTAASATDLSGFRSHPIFHYAGYTIKAAPVAVCNDVFIQPFAMFASNGPVSVISGIPFTGGVRTEQTTYLAGAYLPVHVRDTVFVPEAGWGIGAGQYIPDGDQGNLYGTWRSEEDVTFIFREDYTGVRSESGSEEGFAYEINCPRGGNLMLRYAHGGTAVYNIESLTQSRMCLRDGHGTVITFNKQ